MRKTVYWALGALIVASLLQPSAMRAASPHIQAVSGDQAFRVTFDAGAVAACTVYQQQVVGEPDQNFPDGRYTPRRCWELDPKQTGYLDNWDYIKRYDTDWKVWAEIYFSLPDGTAHMVATNVVDVHW